MVQKIEEKSLNNFGYSFNVKMICCLLSDLPFMSRVFDILKPEYFEDKSFKWLVEVIIEHYIDYKNLPTLDVLRVKLDELSGTDKTLVAKILKEAYQFASSTDLTFIKEQVVAYCAEKKMKNAILYSAELLQFGKMDEIYRVIKDALNAGTDTNIGHSYEEDIEKRYIENKRDPIPTGWDVIDEIMGGGLAPGELGVWIAGPGLGKTWLLITLGAYAKKLSKRVAHYTLELDENYVGIRYDTIVTGIPMDELPNRVSDVKRRLENTDGEVIIKWFPTKSVGILGLKAHLNKLIMMGKRPDLVILDYADLLKITNDSQKHEALQSLYEELRGLGGEYQVPVWTVSQVNRANAQEDIIGADGIADSFGKVMTADFIVSMSRKTKDKMAGVARAHVIKNRFGPDGLYFPMHIDTSIGLIQFYSPKSEKGKSLEGKMQTDEEFTKNYAKSRYDSLMNKKERIENGI